MKKVVIAEDDRLLSKHLQTLLQRAGYEAHQAYHAPGAINLIDDVIPDVIILDMLLGGSTAMPLLNELVSHEDLAGIPIILLTSLAAELDEESLRPYGVREILNKTSTTPKEIVAAVGACLK